MKYSAVLFDLDGTLLDSLEGIALAMNAVLAEQGWPTHSTSAYASMVGNGIEEMVASAIGSHRADEETMKTLVSDYRRHYSRLWLQHSPPYPGIEELLAFRVKKGIALAVLSNKRDDFFKSMVAHFFPKIKFAEVRGVLTGIAQKPDPSGALDIAKKLAMAPESFLYLGDTDVDMQTAGAARMFAGGVAWGFRSVAELKTAGARKIFDHPREVIAFLS
ncbi:MAG: HAD family hydrolase [Chrysiogenales bacterium]